MRKTYEAQGRIVGIRPDGTPIIQIQETSKDPSYDPYRDVIKFALDRAERQRQRRRDISEELD